MPELFEPVSINGMTLKNRFVRSATYEGMANSDGSCTDRLIELTGDLAKGGVGLIIPGYAYISQQGKARPGQTGVHSDELIPGLARMAEVVHRQGQKAALQIAHAGCNVFVASEGQEVVGPSPRVINERQCREMTGEEIALTVEDFKEAAVRTKKAGFDGVQLHAAHGYLLSQFLSPFYNKRTDEYGGSLENRARLVLEVLAVVRSAVGKDYPILIKMNSDDFLEGGFTRTEMVQVASMLEKGGVDAIEISGGTHLSPEEFSFSRVTGIVPEEEELYFADAARLYKEKTRTPLMLVGGIRSYSVARRVIEEGLADFVSLCRPLIREPHLVRRWQSGDTSRAECISCNRCFAPARAAEGVYCVAAADKRRREEAARKRQHSP